tara:strand:+ start:620 stop:1198 length:579 start_codon:yes stop_codon:yes gene_type:complete
MATLKSIKNLYVKDSDAYTLGVGDNANNIALLGFKLAEQEALSIYKMQDGVVDEFEDETGVDTGNSLNESYDSSNDLYTQTTNGDLTLISLGQTAGTAPSDARIVIFEEDIDSITINTDLKAYVSRDNGTTYSEVTLVDEGDYATSKQIWAGSVDISAQPSGTTMRYKIRGFNNSSDLKEFKLHGVCLTWGA